MLKITLSDIDTMFLESSARTYAYNFNAKFRSALGCFLYDTNNNKYLDFLTGAGVLALGHNHECIVAALKEQQNPIVTSLDLSTTERSHFLQCVHSILPIEMQGNYKIHFCGSTGSDGVEAALKLAKINTGKTGVIAFQGSYHGMSQAALSVTSSVYHKERGLDGGLNVTFCPFPYAYRFPSPLTNDPAATQFCLTNLQLMLEDDHSGVVKPGALIVEVIQGEGGCVIAPYDFLSEVSSLCKKHNILFIIDEVQTGIGRTGKWFAFEHYNIQPDIFIISKAIGGGFPMSLMLYKKELDTWERGTHIGTFRGQQYSMTAGAAVIKTIKSQNLLQNASLMGDLLTQGIKNILKDSHLNYEVRSLGLFIGIDFITNEQQDGSAIAQLLQKELYNNRVLVERGGRGGAVVRLLPPLIVTKEIVHQFLETFKLAVSECTHNVLIAS